MRWQTTAMGRRILRVAPSPNREQLLAAQRRSLQLIDCETGTVRYEVPCEHWITSVAFLGNGRSFVIGGQQGQISIWSTRTGQQLFEIANVGTTVRGIVPLGDGFMVKVDRLNGKRSETHWLEF